MKGNYEQRSRHYFPRRGYTLVRVDGKAFHTWTKGLEKPYDTFFMTFMDRTAIELCKQMMGAKFAFVQSDEISILLTDFASEETEAWFDGCQNKIESVSASIATMVFNYQVTAIRTLIEREGDAYFPGVPFKQVPIIDASGKVHTVPKIASKEPNALFDSRAWWMADPVEVQNYFLWRQKDAERNSVTMLAGKYASHKKLHGKSVADRHDIIHEAGDNWNDHSVRFKRGAVIRKDDAGIWDMDAETPVFTRDPEYLEKLVPRIWGADEIEGTTVQEIMVKAAAKKREKKLAAKAGK